MHLSTEDNLQFILQLQTQKGEWLKYECDEVCIKTL